MTDRQVIEKLRAAAKAAGGVRAFAVEHGISASYVYDVLRGARKPGPAIGSALGLTLIRSYRAEPAK